MNNNNNTREWRDQGPPEVVFLCTHNSNSWTRDPRVSYLFMVNAGCWGPTDQHMPSKKHNKSLPSIIIERTRIMNSVVVGFNCQIHLK